MLRGKMVVPGICAAQCDHPSLRFRLESARLERVELARLLALAGAQPAPDASGRDAAQQIAGACSRVDIRLALAAVGLALAPSRGASVCCSAVVGLHFGGDQLEGPLRAHALRQRRSLDNNVIQPARIQGSSKSRNKSC